MAGREDGPTPTAAALHTMTMPHLMNCDHLAEGWCLDCVGEMRAELERLRAQADTGDVWLKHDDDLRFVSRVLSGGLQAPKADIQAARAIVFGLRTTVIPTLADLRQRFAGIPDASGKGAAEPVPAQQT